MVATIENTEAGDLLFNRSFKMTVKVINLESDTFTAEVLDSGESKTFRKGSVTGVFELSFFDKIEAL